MTQLDTQSQVSGLIPQIRQNERDILRLKSALLEQEEALRNTKEFQEIAKIKSEISSLEISEQELREQGKNMMIESGLHDFTTLDGTTIQLNKTPGSLIIEKGSESKIPEEFWKVKKEVDKTSLKTAIKEGKFYDDAIYIDVEYKLVIKQK